jgi:hypothetical protein
METVKIDLKLINSEMPYEYSGIAIKDNNLLIFEDNNDKYIFDKDKKVLNKSNKEKNLVIDFKNSIITVDDYSIDIDVLEEYISNSEIFYRYSLNDNVIKLVIKEVE